MRVRCSILSFIIHYKRFLEQQHRRVFSPYAEHFKKKKIISFILYCKQIFLIVLGFFFASDAL